MCSKGRPRTWGRIESTPQWCAQTSYNTWMWKKKNLCWQETSERDYYILLNLVKLQTHQHEYANTVTTHPKAMTNASIELMLARLSGLSCLGTVTPTLFRMLDQGELGIDAKSSSWMTVLDDDDTDDFKDDVGDVATEVERGEIATAAPWLLSRLATVPNLIS